jgi:hypothetical protein
MNHACTTNAGGGEPGSLRGIHLDLKYPMLNRAYLKDWVKRLPGYGINAARMWRAFDEPMICVLQAAQDV